MYSVCTIDIDQCPFVSRIADKFRLFVIKTQSLLIFHIFQKIQFHQNENFRLMPKEQDPDPHQMRSWIRVRVKMKSRIWIRIRIEVERGNRIRNTAIDFITTSVSSKMFLKINLFCGGRAKTTDCLTSRSLHGH
jgi:hypothetical protein